jgi:hypothetical protein
MGEGGAEIETSDTVLWTFLLTATNRGPAENIEFVARRLRAEVYRINGLESRSPGYEDLTSGREVFVVLGSPLYLASVD